MQAHFDKVFGKGGDRNLKDICTVSWYYEWSLWFSIYFCQVTIEPNATLALEKTALSKSYSTCGIRVLVDDKAVRIATYITAVVAKRNLPASASSLSPGVVMHVGGPQSAQLQVVRSSPPSTIYTTLLQIIPDLLVTGALGQVDSLVLEGRGDDVYRHMVDSIVALGQFIGGWSGRVYSCVCRRVDQQWGYWAQVWGWASGWSDLPRIWSGAGHELLGMCLNGFHAFKKNRLYISLQFEE